MRETERKKEVKEIMAEMKSTLELTADERLVFYNLVFKHAIEELKRSK